MNRIARLIISVLGAAVTAAHAQVPLPIVIDSQVMSAPPLTLYQAESRTIEVRFRNGGVASDVSLLPVSMWWATGLTASAFVTASWHKVDGGTGGVVRFDFSGAALNTNGAFVYGAVAGATFRHGQLKIHGNPYAVGIPAPTFSSNQNLAGYTFINAPWLEAVSIADGEITSASTGINAIALTVSTNLANSARMTATNALAVASNAYNLALGAATGSTDIVARAWAQAASNLAAAAYPASNPSNYITAGEVTGLGTDLTARAWAEAASNLAYSASQASTDLVARASAVAASNLAATAIAWADSASNLAASAALSSTDVTARAWALAASNQSYSALALALHATGNLSNTPYAVNGQGITGRWFAVGTSIRDDSADSFIGGGLSNVVGLLSPYSTIAGGRYNTIADSLLLESIIGSSFIGGGWANYIDGNVSAAVIVGGLRNQIIGMYSDIASIGGGSDNRATGPYATIPGGHNNEATANAFAAGIGARATHGGSVVFSSPGTTNDTFESRGDNTFNVRSVGGVYILAPNMWIQDTNGATVARFSATNSVISGDLHLSSYVTTGMLSLTINPLTTGKLDLASGIAWSNALSARITANETGKQSIVAASAASNALSARLIVVETGVLTRVQAESTYATTGSLAALRGDVNTASNALSARLTVLETGSLTRTEAASQYTTTGVTATLRTDLNSASNALRLSLGAMTTNYLLADAALSNQLASVWAFASNAHAQTWSGYAATQAVNMASNAVERARYLELLPNSLSYVPTNRYSIFFNGEYPYYSRLSGAYKFWTEQDFAISSYQTIAAYNAALTSTLYRYTGFIAPTGSMSSGMAGQLLVTNGYLVIYDPQSNRWGRVALDYAW